MIPLRYNLFLILIIGLSLSFSSCKRDNAESIVDDAIAAERFAIKEQRQKDSLAMVTGMIEKGLEVNGEEISKNLDRNNRYKLSNMNDGTQFPVPPVCNMITEAEIAELFGIASEEVKETNGNRGSAPDDNSKSCFWRWTNSGMLIQISTNPLPDELTDWATRYIESKKTSGEQSMDTPDSRYLFKDFKGPGMYNVYNEELGRYYVAKNQDYMITLIFNGNFGKDKKLEIATKLLTRIHDKL